MEQSHPSTWSAVLRVAGQARHAVSTHARLTAAVSGSVAAAAAAAYAVERLRRPSEEELERRRRLRIASTGRITDGTIVDSLTADGDLAPMSAPAMLLYRYRIGGVTYDCAQDVRALAERASGFRIDQPVQVRYDPRNPGNSVLISEEWSGLRNGT